MMSKDEDGRSDDNGLELLRAKMGPHNSVIDK